MRNFILTGNMIAFPVLLLLSASNVSSSVVVEESVTQKLTENGAANILVSFKASKLREVRRSSSSRTYTNRSTRITDLYTALKSHADQTQANLAAIIQKARTSTTLHMQKLWITNQMIIHGVDQYLLSILQNSEDISMITSEKIYPLHDPEISVAGQTEATNLKVQWGVANIDAPSVWSKSYRGQGVVVANIDTGVRATHEALRNNHRSNYGWFDPYNQTKIPHDTHGHGTHTMGTIVGSTRGIGVAPGATWISCKGCNKNNCSSFALLDCAQWVTCPTDPNGENPRCEMAPAVVSNSWGGEPEDGEYSDAIEAWLAAGILPIFSAGNKGPHCRSVKSPADYETTIAVGSTDKNDMISTFSSVGPTYFKNRVKPDVVAPGSNILSADHENDLAYQVKSGTSMACPHVAGLAALLLGASSKLSTDEIKTLLLLGAQPVKRTGVNCGGVDEGTFPNNHAGYGRISVTASFEKLHNNMSTPSSTSNSSSVIHFLFYKLQPLIPIICSGYFSSNNVKTTW